jgi:hypothetical protein
VPKDALTSLSQVPRSDNLAAQNRERALTELSGESNPLRRHQAKLKDVDEKRLGRQLFEHKEKEAQLKRLQAGRPTALADTKLLLGGVGIPALTLSIEVRSCF